MRDKLIELLIKGNNQPCGNGSPWEDNYCKGCEYENKKDCRVLQLADYLLANGVIVQSSFKIEPIKCTKGSGVKGCETYLCLESGIEMAAKINEIIAYINNNEQALKGGEG